MPSVGFGPAVPTIKRLQIYVVYRTATRIGELPYPKIIMGLL